MCTLAVYFQVSRTYPLVVAANRDEFYDRAATPPLPLRDQPWVVGGRDLVAGGTWLGVNAAGLVAGLVNRRTGTAPDPTRRSRGLLCLQALAAASVAAAADGVRQEPGAAYNAFNLLLAAPDAACVIGNHSGRMRQTTLPPGVHVLTNLDLNDPACPRIAKSHALFAAAARHLDAPTLAPFIAQARAILSDHSTPLDPRADGPPNNLCVHTDRFGTRSSTLLAYDAAARRFRLWHADGAPCSTPYAEVALPSPPVPLDNPDVTGYCPRP